MRTFNRKGSTLVVVVILTTVMLTVVAATLRHSLTERRLNKRTELWLEARNSAEAVVEYGFAQLRHRFENNTNLPASSLSPTGATPLAIPTSSLFSSQVDLSSVEIIGSSIPQAPALTLIDPDNSDNDFDPLRGRRSYVREITLFGKATVNDLSGNSNITAYAKQKLQVRDTPIFSHAIFYNLDLDIHPGPAMDIYGPVHTNKSLRLAPNRTLTFSDRVTVSEHVLHEYEHNSTSRRGHIKFPDAAGDLVSMKEGSTFYDSKMGTSSISDDFRSYASNRWHGNLQTSAHGIGIYNPVHFSDYEEDDPATSGVHDPVNSGRAIIEPPLTLGHAEYDADLETQKMSNKAGLYIRWNTDTDQITARKKDGTVLNISPLENHLWKISDDTTLGSETIIRDRRRGKDIKTLDLNIGKLKELIVAAPDTSSSSNYINGYDPISDWNGVVYVESYTTSGSPQLDYTGVRLHGGQTGGVPGQGIPTLGADNPGLTVATNNVMYVQGHFNADGNMSSDSSHVPDIGEVPVALMADAVTFLSANYSDASMASYNEPAAINTEVSAAVITGIRPPNVLGDNRYSGGAHNFPRFLENWSGDTFYLRGSMVCLYECEVDWSKWSTSYYEAPTRKWGFNDLFKGGTYPPGTPLLRTYRRVDYKNMNSNEYAAQTSALTWP